MNGGKIDLRKYSWKQHITSFTIAYMVSVMGILACVNAITNELDSQTPWDTIIIYGILFVGILGTTASILLSRNIKVDVFFLVIILMLLYILTMLFHPENEEYMFTALTDYQENPVYLLFLYSFPGYIFIRHLDNYDLLYYYLKRFSYIVVIVSAIAYFLVSDSAEYDYMSLSYNMLLQVFFLLVFASGKSRIFQYIVAGLGVFVIAVGGARGALLGLMIGILLIIVFKPVSKNRRIITLSLLILGTITVFIYYEIILMGVLMTLSKMGIESRTFDLLSSSSVNISVDRFEIFHYLLAKVNIFGHGMFGDRVLLEELNHTYAHNLFVEWLIDFGIFGVVFSIGFIICLARAFKNKKSQTWNYLVLFIPKGLIGLLLSGSYLGQEPCFYILLGLCVNAILERKKNEYQTVPKSYSNKHLELE